MDPSSLKCSVSHILRDLVPPTLKEFVLACPHIFSVFYLKDLVSCYIEVFGVVFTNQSRHMIENVANYVG